MLGVKEVGVLSGPHLATGNTILGGLKNLIREHAVRLKAGMRLLSLLRLAKKMALLEAPTLSSSRLLL